MPVGQPQPKPAQLKAPAQPSAPAADFDIATALMAPPDDLPATPEDDGMPGADPDLASALLAPPTGADAQLGAGIDATGAPLINEGATTDLWTRLKSKVGQNPEEQRRILAAIPGMETRLDDTEGVLWRQKGSKSWTRLDPDGFAGSLAEAAKDTFLDLLPDAGQAIIERGAEVGGAVLLPGPGGFMAGHAVGGLASAAARQTLMHMMGAEPTQSPEAEALIGAGMNLGFGAAGAGIKSALGSGQKVLADVVREAPIKRVHRATALVTRAQELLGTTKQIKDIPRHETGATVFEALNKAGGQLSDDLAEAKNIVKMSIDPDRDFWNVSQFVQRAESILSERHGVRLLPDKDGIMRAHMSPDKILDTERTAVGTLVDFYNEAQKRNGQLTFNELDRAMKSFEKGANYNPAVVSKHLQGAMAATRGALNADMRAVLDTAVPSELREVVSTAYDKFHKQIDQVRDFRADFLDGAAESGEKFMEKLILPGQVARVRDLRLVLGEESTEWGMVKEYALAKMLGQVRHPQFGFVQGAKLAKLIDEPKGGWGADVLGELVGPANVGRLRVLARQASKVDLSDIAGMSKSQTREVAQGFLATLGSMGLHPLSFARIAYSVLGQTKAAAEFLSTDAINELAKRAKKFPEKSRWLRYGIAMRKVLAMAQPATDITIKGQKHPTLTYPALFRRTSQAMSEPAVLDVLAEEQPAEPMGLP